MEKINQQLSEQIQLNLVQPTTTPPTPNNSNSDVIKQIQVRLKSRAQANNHTNSFQNQLANQQLLLQQVSSKQQQQQQQIPSLFNISNSNQPTTATVQYLTTTTPNNSSASGEHLFFRLVFLSLESPFSPKLNLICQPLQTLHR